MEKVFAYNIDWDIDKEEIIDFAFDIDDKRFTELFGVTKNNNDAEDIVLDKVHHCPGLIDEIIGIPSKVEIPDEVIREAEAEAEEDGYDETITSWLSDTYGWCINGYQLSTDKEEEE